MRFGDAGSGVVRAFAERADDALAARFQTFQQARHAAVEFIGGAVVRHGDLRDRLAGADAD